MSLSSKLEVAVAQSNANLCKLATIMTKLSAKDKNTLEDVLSVPDSNPYRLTAMQISKALEEEGYYVSDSVIQRHRRGVCSCKQGINN